MTEPETRARATPRDLEILTMRAKDPLRSAHVARLAYAAGERTWSELSAIADRANADDGHADWPRAALEHVKHLDLERLVLHAEEERRAIERLRGHVDRVMAHQPCGVHDARSAWEFFSDQDELADNHVWTLRILRRVERSRRRRRLRPVLMRGSMP